MRLRNSTSLVNHAQANVVRARELGLTHQAISARDGKQIWFPDGTSAVEFVNCSYLGLDQHPKVIEASLELAPHLGVNFCCARTRLSVVQLGQLEERLCEQFRGHAVCFPSLTVAHQAVLPLLAGGVLLTEGRPVRILMDRQAHASMQFLLPILAQEAKVELVPHNDLEALVAAVKLAKAAGETAVFVADTVFSMGGKLPMRELFALSQELDFYLYLDDAHGTSVYGEFGEGFFLQEITGPLPANVFLAFSLSKGFGANGGGIALPTVEQADAVRAYGMPYAFSAAPDFSVVGAVSASLSLHRDGTVKALQHKLRERIARFSGTDSLEPIQMFRIGEEAKALDLGSRLKEMGFFVSTVFFPVVGRGEAQLRACITANHSDRQLDEFTSALASLGILEQNSVRQDK